MTNTTVLHAAMKSQEGKMPTQQVLRLVDDYLQAQSNDLEMQVAVAIMLGVLAVRRFLHSKGAHSRPTRMRVIRSAVRLFDERLREFITAESVTAEKPDDMPSRRPLTEG